MANQALSKEEIVAIVRAMPGYENVHPDVAQIVHSMKAKQNAKATGLAKAQILAKNIVAELRSFNAELHLFSDHSLASQISGFDAIQPEIDLINERLKNMDTRKFNKCAGPPIDYPEALVVQVNTIQGVTDMISSIVDAYQPAREAPKLYLDCEGKDLGREGKVTVMQVFAPLNNTVYIIFAHVLGGELWTISTNHSILTTFKDILEQAIFKKVFWGMPGDSEALFFHHGVRLDPVGVLDLQLHDLACYKKPRDRTYVKGIDLAVEKYLNLPGPKKQQWMATKVHGKRLMKEGINYKAVLKWALEKENGSHTPLHGDGAQHAHPSGGDKESEAGPVLLKVNIWQEFPLRPEVLEYAIGDVLLLPLLHKHYASHSRLTKARMLAVEEATRQRIVDSQDPLAKNPGHDGPAGWTVAGWC